MGVTGTGDPTSGPESEPSSGDHYRANGEGSLPPGYYRVVGRNGECVTLLHVGDKEGRRRHTGRVESVDRSDLAALDERDRDRPVYDHPARDWSDDVYGINH